MARMNFNGFGNGGGNNPFFNFGGGGNRRGSTDGPEKYVEPSEKWGKRLPAILVVLLLALLLYDSVYNVSEQRNAVVTMFGTVVRTDTAGLHFKLPWIQQVHKVDITTQGRSIGYSNNDGEQKGSHAATEDGVMITSDFNLLNIDFYMEYKVSDPVAYLYNSENPEGILENIALASIRSVVSNYTVDEAMTTGKSQIQADIKTTMMKELEKQDIGMQIVNITIQDSRPPTDEINQAFKAVETAKQGADTAKNNALQYQNEQLPAAEAEADKIIQDATAAKEARIAEAEGQVSRFNEMYEQYVNAPTVTKRRLFYETMEDVLPELKVIITDGGTETMLPLDSFYGSTSGASSGNTTAGSTNGTGDTDSSEAGSADSNE